MKKLLLLLIGFLISSETRGNELTLAYGINRINDSVAYIQIEKTRMPSMNAHGYDVFNLTVNGELIALDDFRTWEGADCFVQDFDFYSAPFRIIRKTRVFGNNWADTQPATLTFYALDSKNNLIVIDKREHAPICDVRKIKARPTSLDE